MNKGIFDNLKKLKIPPKVIILILVGIALLFISNTYFNGSSSKNNSTSGSQPQPTSNVSSEDYAKQVSSELESFLSTIDGVGKVKVIVSVDGSGEKVTAKDSSNQSEKTEQKDSQGGTSSSIKEQSDNTTIYQQDSGGNKEPFITKEQYPQIIGVVVSATGGDSNVIKEKIISAVIALYGVAPHKIQVFSMKD
ncbi:MAG: stage III sporulation protein AG [Clostridiales bacterium]|jgi:stage III sporulation protein AG|nr:stage III sporulation protein AG [Clostridiales bacterium]